MGVWIVGYPTQATAYMAEFLDHVRASSRPFELGFALSFAARLQVHLRNLQTVKVHTQEMIDLATKYGFAAHLFHGLVMNGWALSLEGKAEQGIAQMQRAMHDFKQSNYYMSRSLYFTLLVEAYLQSGQVSAGLELVEATLKEIDEQLGERFWLAELYRLKGELWLRQGKVESEAEIYFQNAIMIARRQGAKSLELRAATSLGRLWATGQNQRGSCYLLPHGEFTKLYRFKEAASLLENSLI